MSSLNRVMFNPQDIDGSVNVLLGTIEGIPDIYAHDDFLCVVVNDKLKPLLDWQELLIFLSKHVYFSMPNKEGGDSLLGRDATKHFLEMTIKRREFQGIRQLRSVVSAPFLSRSGEIVHRKGYDEATQVYLTRDYDFDIPDIVTEGYIKAALEDLFLPFSSYTFVGRGSESVILSMIASAYFSTWFPGPMPAYLVESSLPGSGKGKLIDAAMHIALGHAPTPTKFHARDDIMENRLAGEAERGRRGLFFDNVKAEIGGEFVESLITSTRFAFRRFYTQGYVEYDWRPIIVIASNNATVTEDCARRFLKVRIDPKGPRPETVAFDFDPIEVARENLDDLVYAMCLLVKGYYQAGMPAPENWVAMGSFETWSDIIRGFVKWAGTYDKRLVDPLQTQESIEPHNRRLRDAFLDAFAVWEKAKIDGVTAGETYRTLQAVNKDLENGATYISEAKKYGVTFEAPVNEKMTTVLLPQWIQLVDTIGEVRKLSPVTVGRLMMSLLKGIKKNGASIEIERKNNQNLFKYIESVV